jgi:osmotically-inducible protein OsmY
MINSESPTGKTARHNGDDAAITAVVKAELAADQKASTLPKITVDTNRCTVSLNGNLGSVAARQSATELVGQVNGVTNVPNNLQVRAER